jgi:hypothetical protein
MLSHWDDEMGMSAPRPLSKNQFRTVSLALAGWHSPIIEQQT